jgi:hypothetical protein
VLPGSGDVTASEASVPSLVLARRAAAVIGLASCALLAACWQATALDREEPPDGDAAPPAPLDAGPEVPAPLPDPPGPTKCWTLAPADDGGLLVLVEVDIDGGSVAEVGRYPAPVGAAFGTIGLTYEHGRLIMCGRFEPPPTWAHAEIDLATSSFRRHPAEPYHGFGGGEGELVLSSAERDALLFFPDYDTVVADTPTRSVPCRTRASRFAIHGGEVYAAGEVLGEVEVFDARTGAELRTVLAPGRHYRVWGISVAGGRIHIIDNDQREHHGLVGVPRVTAFDRETGDFVAEVRVPFLLVWETYPSGLWCESPGPEPP